MRQFPIILQYVLPRIKELGKGIPLFPDGPMARHVGPPAVQGHLREGEGAEAAMAGPGHLAAGGCPRTASCVGDADEERRLDGAQQWHQGEENLFLFL